MVRSETKTEETQAALGAASRLAGAVKETGRIPAHERARVLRALSQAVLSERDALAALICEEVAKPLAAARIEVDRAAFVLDSASAEAQRFGGEWFPLDMDSGGEGRMAVVRRFPRGACLFITPFNFPLNLAVHKVAPAVAVGAPFLLKPAPNAPKTALRLGALLGQAGWPREAFEVLDCSNETAEALVRDESFGVLSFTGSAKVGWRLKSAAGRKHVVLELGGNAGAVVGEDADLKWAAARCALGGFLYSGQVCVSVQRIFVVEDVYQEFRELLLKAVDGLVTGDPGDEATDVGPLIDEKAAVRVEAWVREAVDAGARVLRGGDRLGRMVQPTVLEAAPAECAVCREEVFGPVVILQMVRSMEEGLAKAADSPYGLHAGVFTQKLKTVLGAWEELQVGGLIINDIPSYRSDAMPYGGAKLSGIGREGVRYAMKEFTEERTLVLKA